MFTLHESIAFGGTDADAIRIVAAHHNLPDIVVAQFAGAQLAAPACTAAIAPSSRRKITHSR